MKTRRGEFREWQAGKKTQQHDVSVTAAALQSTAACTLMSSGNELLQKGRPSPRVVGGGRPGTGVCLCALSLVPLELQHTNKKGPAHAGSFCEHSSFPSSFHLKRMEDQVFSPLHPRLQTSERPTCAQEMPLARLHRRLSFCCWPKDVPQRMSGSKKN